MLDDLKFKKIFPFKEARPNQREVIEKIINAYESGKKYVILSAPTGTGKSCIGYAVARYFGSSYILTSQKVLQDQYYNDFNIPMVLGRANYTCKKNLLATCEMGACFRVHEKRCIKHKNNEIIEMCPYISIRNQCLSAPHSNLNYSYFLSILNAKDKMTQKELIVCDECHNLENELIKQCTVKIDDTLLKYIGNKQIKLPCSSESDAFKCKWLCFDFYEVVKNEYLYLKTQMKSLSEMKSTKEYKKIAAKYGLFEKLIVQLSLIQKMLEKKQDIVVSQDKTGIEFKVLHCSEMFSLTMKKLSDRFLFMSASILDYKTFIEDIGLEKELVEYIECDSTFPIENRLIHYDPVGSMSYKCKDQTIPKLIKKIDALLKENKNVKGIIHTVNYGLAEKIIEGLSFSSESSRLIMPRGQTKQADLNAFYNSDKPYVLISPSLMEGIDLKDDLSRLCIICKMPYANLTDKWTKARMMENNRWYRTRACISLLQMTGRSIRSETDFAKTYILDSDFTTLAKYSSEIFPKWWRDSVIVDQ